MPSCNAYHRKFNLHTLLSQVQPSLLASPLVMLHVLTCRGSISEARSPTGTFPVTALEENHNHPRHVGKALGFVEAILYKLQRGFTLRRVRKLQKSQLGFLEVIQSILILLSTGLLPATDEVSRDHI